jgi:hypothetical protein
VREGRTPEHVEVEKKWIEKKIDTGSNEHVEV